MFYYMLYSQHRSDVIWTPELCLVTTGMKSLYIIFLQVVNIAALYIFFFDFFFNFHLDGIIYHNCISSVKFKEIILS